MKILIQSVKYINFAKHETVGSEFSNWSLIRVLLFKQFCDKMGSGVISLGCLTLILLGLVPDPVTGRSARPYRPVYVPYIFQLFGDKGWDNGQTKSFTGAKTTTANTGTGSRSSSRTGVVLNSGSRVSSSSNSRNDYVESSSSARTLNSGTNYQTPRRTNTGPYYQASSHRTYTKWITGTGKMQTLFYVCLL